MQCPACGFAAPGNAPACPDCGRPFAPSLAAPPSAAPRLLTPLTVRALVYGVLLAGLLGYAKAQAAALIDARAAQAESQLAQQLLAHRLQLQQAGETEAPAPQEAGDAAR
ncbi:MAG: hypothetical protein WC969_08515 [Elusimicrobiota bacterium]|jgi:hypothetical protein